MSFKHAAQIYHTITRLYKYLLMMITRSKTTTDFGLAHCSIYQPVKSLYRMQNSITTDTVDIVDTVRTTLKALPPMKSVRFHGACDIRVDEINEPVCGKGEVKVSATFFYPCFVVVTDMDPDSTRVCWNMR